MTIAIYSTIYLDVCVHYKVLFFPGYGTFHSSTKSDSLQSIESLLPSQHWKLFKHTSNLCPSTYPFTPGQESAQTGEVPCLRTQHHVHIGRQDWDLRPVDPELWATATTPDPIPHMHRGYSLDTGDTKSDCSQGACYPQWLFYVPTQSHWSSTTIYTVIWAARDTKSPALKAEKQTSHKPPPTTDLEPGPLVWQVSTLQAIAPSEGEAMESVDYLMSP